MKSQKENIQRFKEGFVLFIFLFFLFSFSNKSFARTNEVSTVNRMEASVLKGSVPAVLSSRQSVVSTGKPSLFPYFFIFHSQMNLKVRNEKMNTSIQLVLTKEFPPKPSGFTKSHAPRFLLAGDDDHH